MSVVKGFQKFAGEHCATNALRQVFASQGIKLSEEMILGLGEGIGFTQQIDKRNKSLSLEMRGPGLLELEENVCKRLGVKMKVSKSSAKKQAEKELLRMLEDGRPAIVFVDISKLPYMKGKEKCHMGAHAVVVAGIDPSDNSAFVADRDKGMHAISLANLAEARYSAWNVNTMLKFTYPKTLSPIASAIESAVSGAASRMLASRDKSSGVAGIRLFAETIPSLADEFGAKAAEAAVRNAAVSIEESDTGSGGFRRMYGRFLGEASRMLKDPEVTNLAVTMTGLGRQWSTVALKLKKMEAKNMAAVLGQISKKVVEIADSEEELWRTLKNTVG
jgi:hypothetical protein